MHRIVVIHPPAHLWQPHLDTAAATQRHHSGELVAAERPLVLPDHDRVESPVRR